MSPESNTGPEPNDTSTEYVPAVERRKLDERRLTVVEYVRRRNASVSLSELAAEIAALERDGEEDGEPCLERIRIRLHHIDLPLLEELGFLTYDSNRHAVL